MAASNDVARVTDVPAATVSRPVNGQDNARRVARARLRLALAEPVRHPGEAARVLPRRHKEVIGLLYTQCPARRQDVEDTKVIYDDELLRGVNHVASDLDWSVLVMFWTDTERHDFRRLAAISDQV